MSSVSALSPRKTKDNVVQYLYKLFNTYTQIQSIKVVRIIFATSVEVSCGLTAPQWLTESALPLTWTLLKHISFKMLKENGPRR